MAVKNDKKIQEAEKVEQTAVKTTAKKASTAKAKSKAVVENDNTDVCKHNSCSHDHNHCVDGAHEHMQHDHCCDDDTCAVTSEKKTTKSAAKSVSKTEAKSSIEIATHALLKKVEEFYFDNGRLVDKPDTAAIADIQIELQSIMGLSYTYRAVLSKEFIAKTALQYITQRYAQEKPHINGFAPGRASIVAVKQYYTNLFARNNGQLKTVNEYVIVQQLQNLLGLLTRHYNVTFISEPKYLHLTPLSEDTAIECVFKIDVEPSIADLDLADIKVDHSNIIVEESDIDKAMTDWCANNYKPVPLAIIRPAQIGDIATVDLVMKGTSDSMKDITFIIGSGKLAKELEDSLVGKTAGDTYTQLLKISENFEDQSVAGSVIQAVITIKNISAAELYKQDAEMFKMFGVNTLEECREKFSHHIKAEGEKLSELIGRHHMLQKIGAKLEIQLPETTLDNIIYQYVELLANRLKIQLEYPVTDGQKAQLDPIMQKEMGCSYDEWFSKIHPMIISEAKQRLFLAKYGRDNKINVLKTELDQAIALTAANFPGGLENAIEFYDKETNARNRLINQLYHEKLLRDIYSKVTKKEHETTMTKIIKEFEGMTEKMQRMLEMPVLK